MQSVQNYALGRWISGEDAGELLVDAVTGQEIGTVSSKGLDFEAMMRHARSAGGPKLRTMTFQQRGAMLKALAMHLHGIKDSFYPLSFCTGATKTDSWIDIEGGIGNLFAYASLRRQFPNQTFHVDGEAARLSKTGTFIGHHIMVPKEGVAIHINAFNFPVWGMLEKIAVNLLAGVPAIVKPAAVTSYLAEAVARQIIASGILPEGSLQLVCGSARGILDHVGPQDVVTFTGSAGTGMALKAHPRIISQSVPFNMEADSLNCIVLGEDAAPGTPEFDIFIRETRREMTVKCGQKCTAIRRIIVPERFVGDVRNTLANELAKTVIGDPRDESVRMGSLVGMTQLGEVREVLKKLSENAEVVHGNDDFQVVSASKSTGAFMQPTLLFTDDPFGNTAPHTLEAFGPVATIMPYSTPDEAVAIAKLGRGSLCSTIVTADDDTARDYTVRAASHHGRILILNAYCARESTGHGSPMPMLVHGGPGRAGGGEEMGGMRGVLHYLQRTAVQGSPTTLTHVTGTYQYGGAYTDPGVHVFRKHFEDLQVGETIITHKRTITEADIVNFANVSWDHFYAHTDATSLEGTAFTQRVAHGYFILSAAAGLFVDAAKGPVMLNYGLEECRFTKPVYAGATIGVRLTVKEKMDQEQRGPDDIPKGIVKFLVDVYDETGETVAIATILTMVRKRGEPAA